MTDLASLERSMARALTLATGVCIALGATTVACLLFALASAGTARDSLAHMPILVVPGAVGGVYSPGLTEDSVRATARYLAALATNFGSPRSFQERFDELETFASPAYLPKLRQARATLQHDVETQDQERSFFPSSATEELRQPVPGRFIYAVRGERTVYSSGIPMDSRPSRLRLDLQWGVPSRRNRAGIVLEGVEVSDLERDPNAVAPEARQGATP